MDRDWTFREHLSRALPTDLIFYLLRSIPSVYLTSDYSTKSMLDMLEIVIKWLQVSAAECNRRILRLNIQFVSRDLVPSNRATCTVASMVNFFDSKLSVYIESQGFLNRQIPT